MRTPLVPGDGRTRGQSLVEFALVLPLFLVLVMAIMDLGLAVFSYNSITNAAREGARLAVVNQDTAKVIARAQSQAGVARTPTVTVAFYQANDDGTPNTSVTCPIGSSTYIGVGCLAVVTFTGVYEPITPLGRRVLDGTADPRPAAHPASTVSEAAAASVASGSDPVAVRAPKPIESSTSKRCRLLLRSNPASQ